MGAGQSTSSETEDKVFSNTTPIQFEKDLVNHLSDKLASTTPDATRQATLDSHIQARIQAELERLREEEQLVRHEIESALEKENLDKETDLATSGEEGEQHEEGGGDDADKMKKATSSESLRNDLEEAQKKAERFLSRRKMDELPEIRAKQEALVNCYSNHPTTPLDCWREVDEFKQSVGKVEKTFVESLR